MTDVGLGRGVRRKYVSLGKAAVDVMLRDIIILSNFFADKGDEACSVGRATRDKDCVVGEGPFQNVGINLVGFLDKQEVRGPEESIYVIDQDTISIIPRVRAIDLEAVNIPSGDVGKATLEGRKINSGVVVVVGVMVTVGVGRPAVLVAAGGVEGTATGGKAVV